MNKPTKLMNLIKEGVTPPPSIKRNELKAKLTNILQGLSFVHKNDIDVLSFVGTKTQLNKLRGILKNNKLDMYFDEPISDDDNGWVMDAMYAQDAGWITK